MPENNMCAQINDDNGFEYVLEYSHDGKLWATSFFAPDYADATKKLASMKETLAIIGVIDSRMAFNSSQQENVIMSELSIESVHQLLLEDRETIKSFVSNAEIYTPLLMQNTNAIKELLQIKLFDDEQRDEPEEQARDEIEELEIWEEAGMILASHLIDTGSLEIELNINVNGKAFKIVIEQIG